MNGVITGDIVNSTTLPSPIEEELIKILKLTFAPFRFEFFRGDSFQVFIPDPEDALPTALCARMAALKLSPQAPAPPCDLRISIGIGTAEKPLGDLATAKGEAFLLSGRELDRMGKSGGLIRIVTENKIPQVAFAVLSDYLNSIVAHVTQKQAEVIFELLNGLSQQEVAEKLNKSKSTISQHAAAGKWEELEKILLHYQQILQLISL